MHFKWKGMKLAWPSICCSLWRRGRCHSWTGSLSSAPSQSTWKNRLNRYFIQKIYKTFEAALFFGKHIHIKWPKYTKLKNPDILKTLVCTRTLSKNGPTVHKSLAVLERPGFPRICPSRLQNVPPVPIVSPLFSKYLLTNPKNFLNCLTQHFLPIPKRRNNFQNA